MNAIWSIKLQARCIDLNGTEDPDSVASYARRLGATRQTLKGEEMGIQFPGRAAQFVNIEQLRRSLTIKIVKK